MGYPVKLQKVERPTNRSFYVNLPAAVADAIQLDKGEELRVVHRRQEHSHPTSKETD